MADPPKRRGRPPKEKAKGSKSSKAQTPSRPHASKPPPELATWGDDDIEMDAARSPRKAALAASAAITARPAPQAKPKTPVTTPSSAPGKTASSSKSTGEVKKGATKNDGRNSNGKASTSHTGGGNSSRQSTKDEKPDPPAPPKTKSKGARITQGGEGRASTGVAGEESRQKNKSTPKDKKGKEQKGKKRGRPPLERESTESNDRRNLPSSKKRKGPGAAHSSRVVAAATSKGSSRKHADDDDDDDDDDDEEGDNNNDDRHDEEDGDGDDDASSSTAGPPRAPPAKRRRLSSGAKVTATTPKPRRGRPPSASKARPTDEGRGNKSSGKAHSSEGRDGTEKLKVRKSGGGGKEESGAGKPRVGSKGMSNGGNKDGRSKDGVVAERRGRGRPPGSRRPQPEAEATPKSSKGKGVEKDDGNRGRDKSTKAAKGAQSTPGGKEAKMSRTRRGPRDQPRESSLSASKRASSSSPTNSTGGSSKKKASKAGARASGVGGASAYPKRARSAPDVFKAGPSSKLLAKSPGAKKAAKPAPPPPPPPPYRFDYPGWPATGGRELLSVGLYLAAALPMMRFGRSFEVKMGQLEEAIACERPQENVLLAMIHARLLSSRKELKAMRVGEDKFPYSWWTNRLKNRLAQWYLRRAVLRELIEDAERPDGEEGTGVMDETGKEQGAKVEETSKAEAEAKEPSSTDKEAPPEGMCGEESADGTVGSENVGAGASAGADNGVAGGDAQNSTGMSESDSLHEGSGSRSSTIGKEDSLSEKLPEDEANASTTEGVETQDGEIGDAAAPAGDGNAGDPPTPVGERDDETKAPAMVNGASGPVPADAEAASIVPASEGTGRHGENGEASGFAGGVESPHEPRELQEKAEIVNGHQQPHHPQEPDESQGEVGGSDGVVSTAVGTGDGDAVTQTVPMETDEAFPEQEGGEPLPEPAAVVAAAPAVEASNVGESCMLPGGGGSEAAPSSMDLGAEAAPAAAVSAGAKRKKPTIGSWIGSRKGKRTSAAGAKQDALKPKGPMIVCQSCHRRGTAEHTVRCHYEKCGKRFHIRCLSTPLLEVPQGQWYCEGCRAAKRVYGCNACMQNVRPEEILQCDGPKCGLEYHYGCLDPPLTSVPDVKWWYCPACVLTDNRVGCRVCKIDVNYNKLLKCDGEGCDLEWHTYCLDPPLKAVPRGKFICPTCTAAQQHQLAMKREREAAAANERRRRRMAQKLAELEADDDEGTDRRKKRNGRKLGPRERLMGEFDTMELAELRLHLREVDTLLRNLEDAKDDDIKAKIASTDAGNVVVNGSAAPEPEAEASPMHGAAADGASKDGGSSSGVPSAGSGGVSGMGSGRASRPRAEGPKAVGEEVDAGDKAGLSAKASGEVDGGSPSKRDGKRNCATSSGKDRQAHTTGGSSGGDPPVSLSDPASASTEGAHPGDAPGAPADVPMEDASLATAAVKMCDPGDNVTSTGVGNGGGVSTPGGVSSAEGQGVAGAFGVPFPGNASSGNGDNTTAAEGDKHNGSERPDDAGVMLMLTEEPVEDDEDNPLVKGPYESLSVLQRVGILLALCEYSVDMEHVRQRIIDEVDPDTLRITPFGFDSAGRLYYRFQPFWKEMRVYRTVEKDSAVPEVDEAAMKIVGYRPSQTPTPSSQKRRPQRLRGGQEMELVADSIESMEKLIAALDKSKSKSKKDDCKLRAVLAEDIEAMKAHVAEQMEKEEKRKASELAREKRALLYQAPRRRSGRLLQREEHSSAEAKIDDSKSSTDLSGSPARARGEAVGDVDDVGIVGAALHDAASNPPSVVAIDGEPAAAVPVVDGTDGVGGDESRREGAQESTGDTAARAVTMEQSEGGVGEPQEGPATGAEPPAEEEAAVEQMKQEHPVSDSSDERLRCDEAEGDSSGKDGSFGASYQGPAEPEMCARGPADVGEAENAAPAGDIGPEFVHVEANVGTGMVVCDQGRDGQGFVDGALEITTARAEKCPAGDEEGIASAEPADPCARIAEVKGVMATAERSVPGAVHDERVAAGLGGFSPTVANGHATMDAQVPGRPF